MTERSWLYLIGDRSEQWIQISEIQFVETPGSKGKPAGWPDCYVAAIFLRNGQSVGLDEQQWRQARKQLRLSRQGDRK